MVLMGFDIRDQIGYNILKGKKIVTKMVFLLINFEPSSLIFPSSKINCSLFERQISLQEQCTNHIQSSKSDRLDPKPLTTILQEKKLAPTPLSNTQTTPRFVQNMCLHIPDPWEIPTNLRCSRPSMRHGEVFTPVVAKRGVKHVEESLPHALRHVGIMIVEGCCHGIDDVLQISVLLDL